MGGGGGAGVELAADVVPDEEGDGLEGDLVVCVELAGAVEEVEVEGGGGGLAGGDWLGELEICEGKGLRWGKGIRGRMEGTTGIEEGGLTMAEAEAMAAEARTVKRAANCILRCREIET